MYDHVQGELVERQPARVVLRANGVGFEIRVPAGTFAEQTVGTQVCLFTILHVTDGVPMLLGFASRDEREIARRLLAVTGVGPALALTVLSAFRPPELVDVVARGDHAALKRIKGVGSKTAERLCLELRDQFGKLALGGAGTMLTPAPRALEDAIAALVVLGFAEKEAREKVAGARQHAPDAPSGELVKSVLRGGY